MVVFAVVCVKFIRTPRMMNTPTEIGSTGKGRNHMRTFSFFSALYEIRVICVIFFMICGSKAQPVYKKKALDANRRQWGMS